MADSGEEQNETVDQTEHDMYIAQLKEVFDSCDQTGSQSLNREELYTLCDKLQLDDQSEYLVNELLKEKDEVDFEDFKGSFVNILCQTYASSPLSEDESELNISDENKSDGQPEKEAADETKSETGTERDDDIDSEVSPKYVVGNKRYGRRSLPVSTEELDGLADDEEEEIEEVMSSVMSSASLKHSLRVGDATDSEEELAESQKKRQRRQRHGSGRGVDDMETFEAEGQLNLLLADSSKQKEEANYLRGIWDNLGVGKHGYITIEELSRVCTHIDMEEMNDTQLLQLFDKLDADGDGRVSFQDFLDEMFQHNPRAAVAPPTRALSAQMKIKNLAPGGDERITPSIIQGSGVTGIFSTLDPEKTGFAKPDAIVDLWEKYSISNGADILIALGFELDSKVNLLDLSAALEHELLGADETNMSLQAATVSYQQEMRTLKSSLEQAGWAKEKLKLDLAEANARNSLLAKEVDERHASMEKSSESKLLTIEKKYQDQIRGLHGELEKERENFSAFTARHKQSVDADVIKLRKEEGKLREQLSFTQKEVERLGRDLEEATGQLDESERHGQRLQRELNGMENIHRKLSEFENAGILNPEEHSFAQEKIQRLEQDNKDLKDQNDELRVELEQTKHQTSPARRPLATELAEDHAHNPIRQDGSVMSDYIKPFIVKKNTSFSSADYSDDDAQTLAVPRQQKQLLKDDDDISLGSTSDEESLEQLKRQFELEKKGVEESYKLEIAAIEERHDTEKQEILRHLEQEKRTLDEAFQRLQEEALAELAKELQTNFANEKDDLVKKHASEKNYLKQLHSEEKQELLERLQVEADHSLKTNVQELKSRHKEERDELEQALDDAEARVEDLEKQKVKLEQQKTHLEKQVAQFEEQSDELEEDSTLSKKQIDQLKETLKTQSEERDKEILKQKAEMEGMLSRHLQNVSDVERQKHDLEIKFRKQLSDMKMKHEKETMELTRLMEEQKHDMEIKFRKQLSEVELKHREEITELTSKTEEQKHDLEVKFKKQLSELEMKHKEEKSELTSLSEKQKHDLEVKFRKQLNDLEMKHREEMLAVKSLMEEQKQELREARKQLALVELELTRQREEMEVTWQQERQEVQAVYEEKIGELQEKIGELQEKIRELQEKITELQEKTRELQEVADRKEADFANVLDRGVDGLRGQVREDFYRLLDSMTAEAVERERKVILDNLNQREKQLETELDTKKSELSHVFEKEKAELVERYEEQAAALRAELDRLQGKLEEEREALAQRYEGEREALEEQLAQQIKDELEEELCDQMEEIKEAYEDAKRGFEAEATLLRGEIDDLQRDLDRETKNRKQLEELRRDNTRLQQEKRQVEKGQQEVRESLIETRATLEARIDELLAEKDGAVSAVKAEFVEASRQSGRDMAHYEAVVMEKEGLEVRLTQLNKELTELQSKTDSVDRLQVMVEQLTRENTDLTSRLQSSKTSHEQPSTAVPEHAQRAIAELTHEKSVLEERLADTESRLAEIEDMAKKYTHLQFDCGQLAIGQSALEESLHETQDKLADCEAQLYQAERELKDARRYVDKYKLLQKKYEDVCKERDRSTALVKTLKEQMNSGMQDDTKDKKQLSAVLEEKKMLESQLQKVSDKLLEATTNFTVSQSQHIEELQRWKEQCGGMVDLQKFTRLQIDLVTNQRSLREMQELLSNKEEMTSKKFKETSEQHHDMVAGLEDRKQSLEDKLKALQHLLDNHVRKYKEQCDKAERRNVLVVDLYKENAGLMESLASAEEKKKDAVSRCYKLEDQCKELRRMLTKMANLAVS